MLFSDTFKRVDGAIGRGWEEESSSYTIVSNKLRSPIGSVYPDNQCMRPGVESFADGVIQVDFVLVSAINGVPQIQGRIQGSNNDNFYLAYYSNPDFGVAWNIGGTLTTINSVNVGALSVGVNYRIRLIMNGTSISGKLWNLDTSSLLASPSGTDSGISGSAKHGISVAGSSEVDYDNYIAVNDINIGDNPLLFTDRFNGTLSAWTTDTSGGTVAIAVRDNDEKMVLDDTSGISSVSAVHSFSEPLVPYIVEADMYCELNAVGTMCLLDSSDNLIGCVKIDATVPEGYFDTDNDTTTTFAWADSEYKQIRILVDPAAKTMRCQYSTGTGSDPSGWSWVSTAKSYTNVTIAKVKFLTDDTAQGEFRVDECRIYEPWFGVIGDSNTAGHEPTASNPRWNPNPNAPERLSTGEDEAHSWSFQFSSLSPSDEIWTTNFGVNADKISDANEEIQKLLDLGIRHIVIMLGTNDVDTGNSFATMQADMSGIISKINTSGISATLCSIPPSNSFDADKNAVKSNFNAWLVGIASSNNFYFADVHSAVEGTANNINATYDSGDGAHFNTTGLTVIAETISNATSAILSGTITDNTGTGIDCSIYNTNVIVINKATLEKVTSTTVTASNSSWSIFDSLINGQKYIVVYVFEGTYAVTGETDIAGTKFMTA